MATIEGQGRAGSFRFAIVVSKYHDFVTDRLQGGALEALQAKFGCQIMLVESGGDNLAANYSRELADYIIYVIDVAVSRLVSPRRAWGACGYRACAQ